MRMVTSILNSTSVYIHMNRSRMHRVFHWIPAWMTVNMMTLKQATSIITSMIPGEKMSPFASQSKAPVNMKQAISLRSWWGSPSNGQLVLDQPFQFKSGKRSKALRPYLICPWMQACFFSQNDGVLSCPRKLHVVIPHLTAKHWNTVKNAVKNQLSSICQDFEKDPIAFISNKKQPKKKKKKQETKNISKFQLLTLTPPTPGQLNMKSAKVAVRWGRHKSPLQRIPPWHHVVRWRVKGREKKKMFTASY